MFVQSEVSQSHKPFQYEMSECHLTIFRVESESSHDFVVSGHRRVTRTVKTLQALVCKLESMSSHMKFHISL